MTKDMFISSTFTVEDNIKYQMQWNNMIYKQMTRNIYLDILLAACHQELMVKVIFSVYLLVFFTMISFKP